MVTSKDDSNTLGVPYIFISYSSHDKQIADAICHYLEEMGIACWIAPRDILPGQTWASAIIRALKNCAAMVLVYSNNSNSSTQVANEVDKAFSNNKTIIPFMVDSTPPNEEFEYYLSRKHWLVAYPDYKPMFKHLYDAIKPVVKAVRQASDNKEVENQSPVPPVLEASPKLLDEDQADKTSKSDIIKETVETEEIDEIEETQQPEATEETEAADKPEKPEAAEAADKADKSEAADKAEKTEVLVAKWNDEVTDLQKKIISEIIENMVFVEGGELMLGATKEQLKWAHRDEKPAHKVRLSSYWVSKFQLTQEQWTAIMGENPSKYKGDRLPVTNVSLIDCRGFVDKLKRLSGIKFSLPTEAQWEFAARGGIKSKGFVYSGSDNLAKVACYSSNIEEVGRRLPNELGIYNMSGNVEEWCEEKKGKYTDADVVDPHHFYKTGFWTDNSYVMRGGYCLSKKNCRVSYRHSFSMDYKYHYTGMRLFAKVD